MGNFGGGIKSLQAFSITIAEDSTTDTATLSPAVVVANTYLVYNGVNQGSESHSYENNVTLELTNTTTVTAIRASSPNSGTDLIVKGYAIEYYTI